MPMRATIAAVAMALAATGVVAAGGAEAVADQPNPLTPTSVTDTTAWNDWVYFGGHGPDVGQELWRSDGERIELVADVNPGPISPASSKPAGSHPFFLTAFDDWLYFRAESAATGSELWRTDGTVTELVADIRVGPDHAWPSELIVFDGWLYFSAYTVETNFALWRFDGHTLETVPGTTNWVPGDFVVFGDHLYFSARGTQGDGMYRTDGAEIEYVSDVRGRYPEVLDDWIYFGGYTPEYGDELWRTDGVVTELVADIDPVRSSGPYDLTALDGWVYFAAADSSGDNELWRSNGTTTERVADINAGPAWSRPEDLEVVGDWLYFRAETEETGAELWRSNGPTTELVADINPGPDSSEPEYLEAVDDRVYFGATNSFLWWSDGASTRRVAAMGLHVFFGHIDARNPDPPAWTSETFTPRTGGEHTFVLEWVWAGDVRIDIRETATGRWIGASTGGDAPKLLTVDLAAGEEYRIAVWVVNESTSFSVSVIEPESSAGDVLFDGVVDADGVIGPVWTSSTLVPSVSREFTLSLGWDGPADVRIEVRDADSGAWLAAATVGPAPRSVTIALDVGNRYRVAVWSTSGAAAFEVGVDLGASTPDEVFSGAVDADRLTAPKWVSTTFVPVTSGAHAFSLAWLGDAALRVEIRERVSGSWVGSDTSAAQPKELTVDLDAGVDYRVAVWATAGDADFVVTAIPPGG